MLPRSGAKIVTTLLAQNDTAALGPQLLCRIMKAAQRPSIQSCICRRCYPRQHGPVVVRHGGQNVRDKIHCSLLPTVRGLLRRPLNLGGDHFGRLHAVLLQGLGNGREAGGVLVLELAHVSMIGGNAATFCIVEDRGRTAFLHDIVPGVSQVRTLLLLEEEDAKPLHEGCETGSPLYIRSPSLGIQRRC